MGLLAPEPDRYQNLLKLVSDAHLRGFYYPARADFETLARCQQGPDRVHRMPGCAGPPTTAPGRYEDARKATARFVDILRRENFFVEIQDHGLAPQRKFCARSAEAGARVQLKVVCTNDVHYVRAEARTSRRPCSASRPEQSWPTPTGCVRQQTVLPEIAAGDAGSLRRGAAKPLPTRTGGGDVCDLKIPFPKGSERYPRYPLPPESKTTAPGYLRNSASRAPSPLGIHYGSRTVVADSSIKLPNQHTAEEAVRHTTPSSRSSSDRLPDYFLASGISSLGEAAGISGRSRTRSERRQHLSPTCPITIRSAPVQLLSSRLNPERVSAAPISHRFCMRRRVESFDYVRGITATGCVANIITSRTGASCV